jgi:hypothetical protein
MARGGKVQATFVEITGANAATVDQLGRRLAGLGYVRRERGRYGPHWNARELAVLALGVMVVADGIHHTGLGITRDLPVILEKMNGAVEVQYVHRLDGRDHLFRSSGAPFKFSFIDTIAKELEKLATGDDQARDRVIGLTFGGGAVCGWFDQQTVGGAEGERGRHLFGDWQAVETSGFKREARFELPALLRIADLLKSEDGAA